MFVYLGLAILQPISVKAFQVGTPIPGIHGLGCVTIGSTQYAVGGFLGEDKSEANHQVFSLDLENLDPPLWKPTEILLRQGAGYASVARQGNTNNILVLGGHQIKLASGFYSLDTTEQTAGALQLTSPTFPDSGTTVFPYGGGFLQNDQDISDYVYYGGIQYKGDLSAKKFIGYVKRYNDNAKAWVDETSSSGPRTYFNSGNIYKGALYILGGISEDRNATTSLSTVWRYDLVTRVWSQLNCKGERVGSRSHHSTTVLGNKLYLVGGKEGSIVSNRIDILNLDTLEWATVKVPGLEGRLLGCLAHYHDTLVYSFGSPFSTTATAIDLTSYTIVKSPILVPLSTLSGITFGVVFGLITLSSTIFFLYRRYKRIRLANEQYRAQYAEQMRMYNEIESNYPAPLETDIETLAVLGTPESIGHQPNLSYGSMISESLNIEIPKEWFGPSHQ